MIRGASDAKYVETGHLVFAAAGTLRAVRFDPVRLEVLGDPVPVVDEVAMSPLTGTAQYDVSRTGTLVHLPTWPGGAATRSLAWVNREGREEFAKAPPREYFALRLSPDGTRVALDIRDQEIDIWIWEFVRQTLTRLTFNPTNDVFPVWTPDGARVVYTRGGGLFWRRADGTGMEEPLTSARATQFAMSFSPDGNSLVVTEQKGSNDLSLIPMDGKGTVLPLVQTMYTEGLGEVSPDGRWLAYQSNESGQDEVYVRPFPDVNSGRWQVSPSGGSKPVWARSGRELFYLDGAGALTAVPVQSATTFSVGNPTRLFSTRYFSAAQARSYDVAPDGQRFLMIKDTPAFESATNAAPASIIVALNWFEELKARLPSN